MITNRSTTSRVSKHPRFWAFASACLLAGLLAGAALAGQLTTGTNVVVNTPITASPAAVTIAKNEYTRGRVSRYPRGTTVHFHVKNTGNKMIRMQLKVVGKLTFFGADKLAKVTRAPRSVAPGHVGDFNIFFFYRSTFAMQETVGGKVTASAPITIF
jgi:archaellum component FlaG (FlaF/FlaG flagellin family)